MDSATRFAQTIGMFFSHAVNRMPAPVVPKGDIANSRHANSTKAVQTRKARYGKSKLKRGTRDEMKKDGAKVNTEGE